MDLLVQQVLSQVICLYNVDFEIFFWLALRKFPFFKKKKKGKLNQKTKEILDCTRCTKIISTL